MSAGRISVVIPCFEVAAFVGQTIDSVLAQSHPDVEIVAVDDGSTDGTRAVLDGFGARVRVLGRAHHGLNPTRNAGFAASTGARVMFLDADDVLGPGALAALAAALDAAPDPRALAVCPWRRLVFVDGAWRPAPRDAHLAPPGGDVLRGWLRGSFFVPPCAVLWTRAALLHIGPWDEGLSVNTDGDMMLRALIDGVRLIDTSAGEVFYRLHAGTARRSVSMGQSERDLASRMRVMEKAEAALERKGHGLRYAIEIGRCYHELARWSYARYPALAAECARRAERRAGRRAICGPWPHRVLCHLLGLERKERLAAALAAAGISRRARRTNARASEGGA